VTKARILIVGGDPIVARELVGRLTGLGYHVAAIAASRFTHSICPACMATHVEPQFGEPDLPAPP
jgi:hypothetical protein